MDPTYITAISTALVAVGGAGGAAVAFFIKRADRRREANEALLIAHLTAELKQRDREIKRLKRALEYRETDGLRWLGQLNRSGIDPVPQQWTPLPPEDDDD